MDAGLIGGWIGGLIGVIGGLFGTYCSIHNTRGPLERSYMIKASVVIWVVVTVFLVFMFVLPTPYRLWLWVPYGIALPVGITTLNKRLAEIRQSESEN